MEDEILTIKEAAALLKISVPTMYQLRAQHKIPYKKIGDSIRFSKLELIKWVQSGETA